MRDLTCERIQCDEVWAFVGAKAKNVKPDKREEGWIGLAEAAERVPGKRGSHRKTREWRLGGFTGYRAVASRTHAERSGQ